MMALDKNDPKSWQRRLGRRLQEGRVRASLTLREVSNIVNVGYSNVWNHEETGAEPKLVTLVKYMDLYNIKWSEINTIVKGEK